MSTTPDSSRRVLGVGPGASAQEIRRAYRRLARRHHPDLNPQTGDARRFAEIADAYAALSDPAAGARHAPHASGADRSSQDGEVAAREGPLIRYGELELSRSEAWQLAHGPLTLSASGGGRVTLPAGLRAGDRIRIDAGSHVALLTVRIR